MKKIGILFLSSILCIGLFTGCEKGETVPVDNTLPKMDMVSGKVLNLPHDIEQFKFNTTYDVGKYSFDKWRITDSKNIKFTATVENVPEGAEVLIEHAHVDISLKSTHPQLDGLSQDSMDDTYHGVKQDGFYLNKQYPYENTFAIEGFSKEIIEGWEFYCGDYGSGSVDSRRLTEESLIKEGVYANKLQVVYDLLIKYKGEDKYHTKSVVDELLIPIPQYVIDKVLSPENTKDKK